MLFLRPDGRQQGRGNQTMAMAKKNQCIHCSVESCQHHELSGLCALSDIQVAPKEKCCSGKADESQCSSYKCRW